ncbi:hypothetical protein A9Q84_02035 [Halobacteriovorax marinus]|uniref:Lipoprotein n=1 Tax=Halobacteriovorax marinus TaxID=97084 RepID=A0A1Y5FCS6_9BACT|nr:hypothetical protein A9Q84_02035 [Halobacteriovorax marinus]
MKNLLVMAVVCFGITSCATKDKVATNSHALAQREIASSTPECMFETHSRNKNWHRVSVNGTPYNKHWYSKNQAMKIKNKLSAKGQCN